MIPDDKLKDIERGDGYTVGLLNREHSQLSYLKENTLVARFDGIERTMDYITKNMPTPKREGSSSTIGLDGMFYTFHSFEQALDVFRHHPESVANFDETQLHIKDTDESGNNVEYDVIGDYIDMGRYMEGIPEVFGSLHNGNARNRRIKLVVSIGQAHYISAEDINHRAERILRLVDALENGGARCEVICITSTQCEHVEMTIKQYAETLVINDLAVVSHSDWLRRIMFRIKEYSPTWSYGYGSVMQFENSTNVDMIKSDNVNEITIFVDGSLQGIQSIDKKFDQVEHLLVWELSKSIPEVTAIKLGMNGVYFADNGSRDAHQIQMEGREIIKEG